MTRLAEKYRPRRLANIVGQPAINLLARFAAAPYSTCWLLTGDPGTGKSTAAAAALASELGAPFPELIAAAPALLAACEIALRGQCMDGLLTEEESIIRAAIDQATGEQPKNSA